MYRIFNQSGLDSLPLFLIGKRIDMKSSLNYVIDNIECPMDSIIVQSMLKHNRTRYSLAWIEGYAQAFFLKNAERSLATLDGIAHIDNCSLISHPLALLPLVSLVVVLFCALVMCSICIGILDRKYEWLFFDSFHSLGSELMRPSLLPQLLLLLLLSHSIKHETSDFFPFPYRIFGCR